MRSCNRPEGMVENALDCNDAEEKSLLPRPEFVMMEVDNNL